MLRSELAPGPRTRRPRARAPRVEQRFQLVERRLAEGASTSAIRRELEREHGVARRSSYRYLAACLERLRLEATDGAAREQWRARLQAMALRTYELASGRQRAIVRGVGGGIQTIEDRPDPDSSGAASALRVLQALAGLGGEGRGGTSVTVNTGSTVIVGADAARALSAFYTGASTPAIDATPTSATPRALAPQNAPQALDATPAQERVP